MGAAVLLCGIAAVLGVSAAGAQQILVPEIDGDWWRVAGNPDLGEYTSDRQQPVDFGVWQAADGTWQLWSCIRFTKAGGHTRMFHRWEGESLTSTDWKPMGIAMESRPDLGEPLHGLQAPHVVEWEGKYVMGYGDWDHICFAVSDDGKTFERVIQPDGTTGVFHEVIGSNTRDVMFMRTEGLWYAYYSAFPGGRGYVYARTSPDLKTWSHSAVVAYGGWAGNNPYSGECPHVVEPEPGVYYLFRTQRYGMDGQTTVYRSENPLQFGVDNDAYLNTVMDVSAPELFQHDGQWYMAALTPELDGIRIAKLRWKRVSQLGEPLFDFEDEGVRATWMVVEGEFPSAFTSSTRTNFSPPMPHFIGTAETEDGYDDSFTGVIESPEFTIDSDMAWVYVSGGGRGEETFVEVVDAATGERLAHFTGGYVNTFEQAFWDTREVRGKAVMVRVVDRSTASWGHVNFGGMFVR